ncbi:MAG: hypothetical protein ABWY18_11870 [Tardiphaga sp.]
MFSRQALMKSTSRAVMAAAVAALTATSFAPTGAIAAPAAKRDVAAGHGTSDSTEFSSARRRHYRGGGGNAAGLAAFGAIAGTIGAIAASQSRRDYYDSYGYYGGGPVYSGPAYYGGGYGGGYYGGPYRGYGGGHGWDNSRRMTW